MTCWNAVADDQHLHLSSDLYDTIIRIKVGTDSEAETFEIHKGILCFYSEYFQGSLNGSFVEAKDKVVGLPTESPETFKLFKDWLYTQKIVLGQDDKTRFFTQLCRLWIFGDAHIVPLLQNAAADMITERSYTWWCNPSYQLHLAYENTVTGSKLRYLLVDTMAKSSCTPKFFKNHDDRWTKEALVDLASILIKRPKYVGKGELSKLRLCDYHVHSDGDSCDGSSP